jgi:hypothetical protein
MASRTYKDETPKWHKETPDEWLTYHLVHPGPGIAFFGDPNPAFFSQWSLPSGLETILILLYQVGVILK